MSAHKHSPAGPRSRDGYRVVAVAETNTASGSTRDFLPGDPNRVGFWVTITIPNASGGIGGLVKAGQGSSEVILGMVTTNSPRQWFGVEEYGDAVQRNIRLLAISTDVFNAGGAITQIGGES